MTLSWPAASSSIFCESHNEEYICNEDDVRDARADPTERQIGGDSGLVLGMYCVLIFQLGS